MNKKMFLAASVIVIIAALAVGCTGNGDDEKFSHFLFASSGMESYDGYFIAKTSNPEIIEKARSQINKDPSDPTLLIIGFVKEGDGGHNVGWSWHFDPASWDLAESAIELCDSNPRMVEESVDEWIDVQFCPWGSYVLAELPPGP